ncbi:SAM-dependent methyltransferase [Paractinoplanes hotanensis]|uniref:Methyltransferase domain-containing protein n=1 Tax=Paractinoplanes hotanensis TaxID=2906497 RepID=A0ABT0YD00_9ACTN|nr:methyltransferase domain-containing protein [Actinoplanes hotanensis]MCM4083919.1 methyltransferase domain-containing protein [Actinoplanes hotanensis]
MTVAESHERKVRRFYSEDSGGEAAAPAYQALMGDMWFHGDWSVQKAGGSAHEAKIAMLHRLARHARIEAGSCVLEFGSGYGGAAVELASATGATIVGVSNTDSINRYARRLATLRGVDELASFRTIGDHDYRTFADWPAGSIDAVLFMESPCHLPDREAFFTATHRILKPGGRLVGLDWIQRPFGQHRTTEQISQLTDPVCQHFRLAGLGTLDSYTAMMSAAGFVVKVARDEFPDELCLGSTEPPQAWQQYDGRSQELVMAGKRSLDTARAAGVFTVGWWVAERP